MITSPSSYPTCLKVTKYSYWQVALCYCSSRLNVSKGLAMIRQIGATDYIPYLKAATTTATSVQLVYSVFNLFWLLFKSRFHSSLFYYYYCYYSFKIYLITCSSFFSFSGLLVSRQSTSHAEQWKQQNSNTIIQQQKTPFWHMLCGHASSTKQQNTASNTNQKYLLIHADVQSSNKQ